MKKNKIIAIIYALFAAIFYAFNVPFSKLLLNDVPTTFMASFLYLGAGIGVGIMYIFNFKKETKESRLSKNDIPYTIGMVLLDILAPILLMLGLKYGTASNASLLGNFEIVATTLIALLIFKELVSFKLWIAIVLITIASGLLSFNGAEAFELSFGSLFVLAATCCWGLENNCTRRISNKSTYQIVTIKGLCSGVASFIIAFLIGEKLPAIKFIFLALVLGFVAYGLSIFMYVRAQRDLGASKTSAYYAIAPFIGVFLSMIINKEELSIYYVIALAIMIAGAIFVVIDTLSVKERNDIGDKT